jgi:hypothetical protein
MTGQPSPKLRVEGVVEFWLRPSIADSQPLSYRPAAIIDCSINFRSLRAGLNHSEERTYTAWLPEGEMAIDWDSPAVGLDHGAQISAHPPANASCKQGDYQAKEDDLAQFESELIDKLARNERLRVYFNPVFGLFAAPDEEIEDFLARVAEAALSRVAPELRYLRNKFELQLEQIRESHATEGARAEGLSFESLISQKLQLFESENRLAAMFSTLAGSVLGASEQKQEEKASGWDEAELHEDLRRMEQEASRALSGLYEEYTSLANEYDFFEIGLQPANIQVTRRAVLWVPVGI